MTTAFRSLVWALVASVLLVYMILVVLYESFLTPAIRMLSIPCGIIGAFAALALTGKAISIISFIGLIMLDGLISKNGTLLIDYTNTLVKRGMSLREALLEAGVTRLRPILMTSVTMIVGMLPLALSLGASSEIRSGMAVVLIGGLVTSTLLTPMLLPVVYTLIEEARTAARRGRPAQRGGIHDRTHRTGFPGRGARPRCARPRGGRSLGAAGRRVRSREAGGPGAGEERHDGPRGAPDIEISVEYAARIRAREEIVVSSKVPGRVATVRADVGQRVQRGQVLFTLESLDYDAQVRQARAALESARANLTRTSDSSLSSQLIQAQAAVKQAQVQYDDAKELFDRTQKLYSDGTASRQQLDSVEARYKSADIALATARDNLTLIQEKGGPQSTGLASTQVDQAQAALDLAQSQLSNARVTSPISGLVSVRSVDPGELVSSALPAFVIIDVSTVMAEASVSESIVEKVRLGERVSLSIEAAGSAGRLQGTVESISPAADPRTQGYTVKVAVGNPRAPSGPACSPGSPFPWKEGRTPSWSPTTPWSRKRESNTSTSRPAASSRRPLSRPASRMTP